MNSREPSNQGSSFFTSLEINVIHLLLARNRVGIPKVDPRIYGQITDFLRPVTPRHPWPKWSVVTTLWLRLFSSRLLPVRVMTPGHVGARHRPPVGTIDRLSRPWLDRRCDLRKGTQTPPIPSGRNHCLF